MMLREGACDRAALRGPGRERRVRRSRGAALALLFVLLFTAAVSRGDLNDAIVYAGEAEVPPNLLDDRAVQKAESRVRTLELADRRTPELTNDRIETNHARAIFEQLTYGKKALQEEKRYRVPERPTVYLTFDDGPSKLTEQVLDILAEEGIAATFFVLGEAAERHADLVKRMAQEGHAIGNHTYNHRYAELYEDFGGLWDQVLQTDEIIYQLTGKRSRLFRAPGGTHQNFDPFYAYYMEQAGYIVYDWDVDSGDAKRRGVPADEILYNVVSAPLKHEIHVLLHDGAGHEETVKALPEIIRYYQEQGYAFDVLDPSVQPRQFSLGKLKWKRKISFQQHEQFMERIMDFRTLRENGLREHSLKSWRQDPAAEERLLLQVNGRNMVLSEREFYIVDGHYQVPLDRLTAVLGGRLWKVERKAAGGPLEKAEDMRPQIADGMKGPAAVDPARMHNRYRAEIAGHMIVYDPAMQSMIVRGPGGEERSLTSVQLEEIDGRLFVPLRGTVEMLGGSIPSYSVDQEMKQVRIDMPNTGYGRGVWWKVSGQYRMGSIWSHPLLKQGIITL